MVNRRSVLHALPSCRCDYSMGLGTITSNRSSEDSFIMSNLQNQLVKVVRGLRAEFSTANPLLELGAIGIEIDTGQCKIGDGVKRWNSLFYIGFSNAMASASYVSITDANNYYASTTLEDVLAELRSVYAPFHAGVQKDAPGYWYTNAQRGGGAGSQIGNNGQLTLTPIFISRSNLRITRVAVKIGSTGTGSSGSVMRLGLYASDSLMVPSTLVADWGTVDTTAATSTVLELSGLTTNVNPGTYWIGGVAQGSPVTQPYIVAVQTVNDMRLITQGAAGTAQSLVHDNYTAYSKSSVTGALPSTLTGLSIVNAGTTIPLVAYCIETRP